MDDTAEETDRLLLDLTDWAELDLGGPLTDTTSEFTEKSRDSLRVGVVVLPVLILFPAVKSKSERPDDVKERAVPALRVLSGRTNGFVVAFGKACESAIETTRWVACRSFIVPPGLVERSGVFGRSLVGDTIRVPLTLISMTCRPLKDGPGSCIPFAYR